MTSSAGDCARRRELFVPKQCLPEVGLAGGHLIAIGRRWRIQRLRRAIDDAVCARSLIGRAQGAHYAAVLSPDPIEISLTGNTRCIEESAGGGGAKANCR